MDPLVSHELHHGLGARFAGLNGIEVVADYGDAFAEHSALRNTAGVLDLSFRSRVCLTGADRVRFLHGQVTNDVNRLRPGQGAYAALVTAKGKMESDLNIHVLSDELLLDFEPGLAAPVSERLRRFIVSDDVDVIDVAPLYGLLSVNGPRAEEVVRSLEIFGDMPRDAFLSKKISDPTVGEMYLMNLPRIGLPGFDLFVPASSFGAVADKLITAAKRVGGRAVGWDAFETARIEAGIPRFGIDMDGTNIPLEAGIEERAVSYSKGCYIGQEIINRIHTIGHVNRELRGLLLSEQSASLPVKGEKIFRDDTEVGYVTSAVRSPSLNANIALGYVRREVNQPGTTLKLGNGSTVEVAPLPFVRG